MNARAIGSVVLGLALWPALFMVLGIGLGLLWHDYRMAARTFFATEDFSQFTVGMMLLNFVLFAVIGAISGWLVTHIGRTRTVGLVLAGIWFANAAVDHFYLLWGILPDWYNLVVPWIIGGSIVLGSRIAKVTATPPAMPSTGNPADR